MFEDASQNYIVASDDEDDFEEEKVVRCKMCAQEITKASSAISPHEQPSIALT